jgi:hypothetical protein
VTLIDVSLTVAFLAAVWWLLYTLLMNWRSVLATMQGFVLRSKGTSPFKSRSVAYGLLSFGVVASVALAVFFTMSTGASSAYVQSAEAACLDWFKSDSDVGAYDAFLDGTWEKDGHVVVEIGFNKQSTTYSSRLCVYDPVTRNMTAPNNFTRSRWE